MLVAVALLSSACGEAASPEPGEDGRVDATPRALAAIVVDHVDPGEPRRTTGSWSDWNDPPALEAQIDYGVDPEGAEDGETRTVRVGVVERSKDPQDDELWLHCRPARDHDRCEESTEGDATVVYRWSPGTAEEEAGTYSWTVVDEDDVVNVSYEGSGLFEEDPRGLDPAVEPEDLRAAALDPAMGLRTTEAAWRAGADLDSYDGMEQRPERPEVRPTTPKQLAAVVEDYADLAASSVRRSRRTDFGPGSVGARLLFEGTRKYDPFTIDILTTTGRVSQIDPLPCPVQRAAQAARRSCFAWDRDTAATWTLAEGRRPGVLWIIGAQHDDEFNRVESVGLRIASAGIVAPFLTAAGDARNRLPRDLFGYLYPLTGDLSVGPETQLRG